MIRTAALFTTLLALPGAALAQQAQPLQVVVVDQPLPERDNRLSLNPVGALLGVGSFTYERAVSDNLALKLMPSMVYLGFEESKVVGGALGLGLSYYVTGDAPNGLHFSIDATPGVVSVDPESGSAITAFMFQSRAMLGYNWTWQSGFTLGLAGGVQYLHFGVEDELVAFNGILPAGELNLGFVF